AGANPRPEQASTDARQGADHTRVAADQGAVEIEEGDGHGSLLLLHHGVYKPPMLHRPAADRSPLPRWCPVAILAILAGALPPFRCRHAPTPGAPPAPTGEPTLNITSPAAGSCVEVGDARTEIPVSVVVKEVHLRPPGVCDVAQCGSLLLKVNGVENNRG